jgi:hypothetical protein
MPFLSAHLCLRLCAFFARRSITVDPENVTAINTLAGMGIVSEDDGLVDAALSEILALPLDLRRTRDLRRDVSYLLTQQHLEQVCLACFFRYPLVLPSRSSLWRDFLLSSFPPCGP